MYSNIIIIRNPQNSIGDCYGPYVIVEEHRSPWQTAGNTVPKKTPT